MFRSEKLVRITIQVPEQFISAATAALARFRLLHLIRIDETHLGHLGYVAGTDAALQQEYEALSETLERLLTDLALPPRTVAMEDIVIPEKEIFKIRDQLREIQSEVEGTTSGLRLTDQHLQEKQALMEKYRFLPADLDLSRLSQCRFVNWMIGLVPARGLEKLEESLSEMHHALIDIGKLQERAVILVFGLKKDWPVFERALKGAFFEKIEIPAQVSGTVDAIMTGIQSEIAELEQRKLELSEMRGLFQHQYGSQLLTLKEKAVSARNILAARRFFGKIDRTYLISGWVPERLFAALEVELKRVTEGQLIFEKVNPEELREVREGIVKIPILFSNPMLISPFEKLTSLYGTPSYREVEPTVFFALSFLLMFGMMFGDVGQGGVLFVLGYLVFRRFYRYMDYGVILMECGLSAAFFGLLYGSVFGLENLIPALWFRPLENISYFVKVALALGVGVMSLGLILNLVNAWRLKEYETLLSAGGLAGALFYWMFAGLGLKYLLTGQLAAAEIRFFGWGAGALTAVMVLHRPVYRLLFRKESLRKIVVGAGFFSELMESTVELFDDLLRYLANTVSFIRIAAFALSHAALFIAVFSIADAVSQEKGTGLSYWLVVALGNVVIILLEGLVVSIQTVRLEYYEFFSKFFRGGGEKFKAFDREIGPEGKKS